MTEATKLNEKWNYLIFAKANAIFAGAKRKLKHHDGRFH